MSKKQTLLQNHFPMIRTREEILTQIRSVSSLNAMFQRWAKERQEKFLDFCSGARGVKMVYDGIFKEIFNPEIHPERLEAILSLLLKKKVKIKKVLPNDSVRLGAESSLLYTDIIVELEDGSLSNIEIQKIGYMFPGERSACYSADHLLRQYKRVRSEQGEHFTYRNIKKVYTIVFFECSAEIFQRFPHDYIHRFRQVSDTGLEMDMLQEYIYITLDIFKKNMENRITMCELDAWLAFLSFDDPEWILRLARQFPQFEAMYRDVYEICLNTEKVMGMYSKELEELDRNTVRYMIDEMQMQIDRQGKQLSQKDEQLSQKDEQLSQKDEQLLEKDQHIRQLQKELEAYRSKEIKGKTE